MSRLAFSMDKILRHFGFTGKAFFPLSLSLGCNVIGVQSTRIIEDNKVKILLYLMNSFVPCSARIGVLAILIGVFIDNPLVASLAMFLLMINSLFIVFIGGRLISKMINVKPHPLSIELPPYRLPPKKLAINISWIRTKLFIRRAGLLIFFGTLVLWVGMNIPPGVNLEESLLGKIGLVLEPLGTPLGLEWKAILALLLGFIAKENTLVVLQSLYGGLSSLPSFFDLPKAIAFIVFYAYYTPCIATIATIKNESNSWLVTISAVLVSLLTAYIAAFIAFVILSILL
jgi:ferrous iron transport protein B